MADAEQRTKLQGERWELLEHLHALTEKPMVLLGFAWLGLLILDFTRGLSPSLHIVTNVIWGLFVVDFLIEFAIAPHKAVYLRRNWLTAISLLLPALRVLRAFRALRVFRFVRAARAARSTSLLRLISSLNRGMRATRLAIGKRGMGYAAGITVIVLFAAAAGMLRFENPAALREASIAGAGKNSGLTSYADALWWTAMMITTFGSEYWPQTAEGRIVAWLLSAFGLAVFSYITANIATAFLGQDPEKAQIQATVNALAAEVAALREEVARAGRERGA